MKFRTLLTLLFLATAGLSQTVSEFRAVKITNVDSDVLFSDAAIAEAMDYLSSIGINVILPVVWNGHQADGVYTLYPSAVMDSMFGRPLYPYFPAARDPLKRVIIEAHRNGMEVLPWFEMGFSPSYSQNGGYILEQFPAWGLRNNAGHLVVKNGFDWMSAANPEVQEFILDLVKEVVDCYDVDGIEFSDRIPAMPVEGGYDAATVARYSTEHNGATPPTNDLDPAWMRWRADVLNAFNQRARDAVKARGEHLIFSSSPSVYPWSYDEYLQDSKTWVDRGIVDNIIPQLYRYSISDYTAELNRSLSAIPSGKRPIFFAGVLIKLGDYTISPEFLFASIQANRNRNVSGEALFFYEGLRANDDLLGDTLKATYYSAPALNPHRNGMVWRPKALIVNEDDPGARIAGQWDFSTIAGFRPNILIKKDTSYAAIRYDFHVPVSAWYDVFAYIVTGPLAANAAPFTVFSDSDSETVTINQQSLYNRGWQFLQTVFLPQGERTVLKLDNANVAQGQFVSADAAMLMLNRKRSTDVLIPSNIDSEPETAELPETVALIGTYPNPFNMSTKIRFRIDAPAFVELTVFDLLGRQVATLMSEPRSRGTHEVIFSGTGLASGLYVCRLAANGVNETIKIVLIK
ncbi:MAG: family 10 glycosylhydrolase [Candidatus Zhuqueibacterota bacterium]